MEKIIYVNQPNIINSEIGECGTWEIDDNENLEVQVEEKSITIIPDDLSLNNPQRLLRYTAQDTEDEKAEHSQEFELIIKKSLSEQKIKPESGLDISKVPKIFKVSPQESIVIPGTQELLNNVSWFFSNDKFNSCLNLSEKGVAINKLPAGMYTLYYQISDQPQEEISIQSIAKTPSRPSESKTQHIPKQKSQPKPKPKPEPPSLSEKTDDTSKNWPKGRLQILAGQRENPMQKEKINLVFLLDSSEVKKV